MTPRVACNDKRITPSSACCRWNGIQDGGLAVSNHHIGTSNTRKIQCPYQSPKKNSRTPGSRTAVHVLMVEKKNCLERRNLAESTTVRIPVLFESCRGSVHTRP
ncbi:hypothetical protein TNCV_3408911 [Trichonephila clavipes]|nr:hypothetical protein TNCV_3408911 [Trichonephila clavipes]